MSKALKEGASYSQRDVLDVLSEFSSFKDRVEKKYKELAKELEGKPNEHELWVNLYMITSDYAEEIYNKRYKQQQQQQQSQPQQQQQQQSQQQDSVQKVS